MAGDRKVASSIPRLHLAECRGVYPFTVPVRCPFSLQDGAGGGHMRDVQGPAVRLQGGHLVPGGHPDRAGPGGAAQPRDEPHEGAAKDSQGRAAHPDAALPLVSLLHLSQPIGEGGIILM